MKRADLNNKKNVLDSAMDHYFSDIKIPEGLEGRISSRIDSISVSESHDSTLENKTMVRSGHNAFIKYFAVAASVIIIAGAALWLSLYNSEGKVTITDTCSTIDQARLETETAFKSVARAMDKGMSEFNKSTKTFSRSAGELNKYMIIKNK
ncbi:MAG: hypothetical protein LKI53_08920 [Bacteroidales bacterium]|jgi:hypothetical protein|nr:hypothetical protein [Bacteroidales bacterium]